jgi:hypothetical protein
MFMFLLCLQYENYPNPYFVACSLIAYITLASEAMWLNNPIEKCDFFL